ncbi:hypothetical protein [Sanguibacter sp. 25GB23B1]|uniref:hypothetical protein n=1 Tax=unclassified Sanguibacter TaxID=2645534 RepID=UPI0032AFE7C6
MAREQQGAGSADASDRLERSARLWLRAYPRRWRAAFGDDLVGVLREVGPPGSSRVPTREAVAIVRAGWALRLREHPPLLRWLGYRFLDLRLPLRYQHWVVDDILGRFYVARTYITGLVVLAGVAGYLSLTRDWDEVRPILNMYLAFLVVMSFSFLTPAGRRSRRTSWQRHVSPEVPVSLLSRRDQARDRRPGRTSDESGTA